MKIKDRTVNFLIISIYLISLFLGNENFLGLINVGSFINYIIVLLPAIFICLILVDNRKNIKLKNFNKVSLLLAIMFLLWCFITFVLGINKSGAGIRAIIHFSIILLIGLLLPKIKFERYQIEKIKKHIFITFFIVMLYGIIEYIFQFNLDTFSNDKYPGIRGRVYSTLFIATLYDKYICIMSTILAWEMLKNENRNNNFYKLLFIMAGISMALTFSRTGLLIYLGILFLFLLLSFIYKNMNNVLIVIITIIIMFFIPGVTSSFQSGLIQFTSLFNFEKKSISINENSKAKKQQKMTETKKVDEEDPSREWRDYYKSVGKQFMKEYPITGIGIGNYSYLYNNQNAKKYLKHSSLIVYHYMYPHSSYVQMGAEIGIIGVIIFYLFIFSIIFNVSLKNNKKEFLFMLFIYLVLIAISYVEGIVYSKQFMYLFIILYSIYSNKSIIDNKKFTNNKKINTIDILALHLGRGGIETSICNTANILSEKYKVRILSVYNLNDSIANKIDKKVKIEYLLNDTPNKKDIVLSLKSKRILKFISELKKGLLIILRKKKSIIKSIINSNADCIISTRTEFNVLLSKYGSNDILKIGQEHKFHNNEKNYINIIKYKLNRLEYLCALTTQLKIDYEKYMKNNNNYTKVVLVPNMIDVDEYKKSKVKGHNLIFVGRLVALKRVEKLIKMISNIKEEYHLSIVGDGEEYDYLKKKYENECVSFYGSKSKDEIIDLLSKHDLFVFASSTEGLPMVLLEAMASGLPIVAFDYHNSVDDIIKNNKTGYIIKDDNEIEFTNKVEKLLLDSKLRMEFSNMAIKEIKKFSKNNIKSKWYKLLG